MEQVTDITTHAAFHSDPFFYNCILKCNINTGSSNNNSHARTTSSKLNLLLWNARSLNKQINDFQSFVYSETFDIIAITKTWLTNNIYTNEIFPSGYTVLRKDRDSRDGGVLLALKDSLNITQLSSPNDFEIISADIDLSVFCLSIYRPLNSSDQYSILSKFFPWY